MRRWAIPVGLAAVLLAACGSATPVATTTTTAPTTTSTSTSSTSTTPAAACSAARLSADLPADSALPPPVAAMRSDLARAAVRCDWGALATLADRNGKAVRYTFGEGNDPVTYWKGLESGDAAVKPMRALRLLLGLPGTETKVPNGPSQYVWPPVFAVEHPTEAQLQQVADTGLYTMATLNDWVAHGMNYLGYRILVTAEGDWTAFVEGD